MDYIYHLYKIESVLIEVLQRRREEKLRIAYVNRAELDEPYLTVLAYYSEGVPGSQGQRYRARDSSF